MDKLITLFQQQQPHLVKDMHQSTHHFDDYRLNPYHLEGDVWGHTLMVCLMAKELGVSKIEQYSCLLHDVGKPLSREVVEETRKVRFFGHEGLSVYKALPFMLDQNLTVDEIRIITEIISMHTDLYKIIKRPDAIEKVAKRFVGNKELLKSLINVAICDAHGRFYDEEQANSFPRDKDFWSPYLSSIKEHKVSYKPRTATVLVGPPLSGKSTWIKNNTDNSSVVISRDQVILDLCPGLDYTKAYKKLHDSPNGPSLISEEFEKRKREAVKSGKDIVFDLTHMSKKARRRSLSSLTKDFKTKAVVFLTPFEELINRNHTRTQEEGKNIPFEVLVGMMKAYTCPLYDEVDEIEYKVFKP